MWVYFLYQVCERTLCISEARFLISKVRISCFVTGSSLALYQLSCIASRCNYVFLGLSKNVCSWHGGSHLNLSIWEAGTHGSL